MMRKLFRSGSLLLCLALFFPTSPLSAAEDQAPRKLSKKEEKKRLKRLRKELRGPFKKWLDEDVLYIITGDEKKTFLGLATV